MNEILFVILLIFCVVALIELIQVFSSFFLKTKKNIKSITVVPITKDVKDVEFIVRQIVWNHSWNNITNAIILLNLNADEETCQVCSKISKDHCNIDFLSQSEFDEFVVNYEAK